MCFYAEESFSLLSLQWSYCDWVVSKWGKKETAIDVYIFMSQERFHTKCTKTFASQLRNIFHYHRWLSVRLEFLGNLMVFFAALLAVLAGKSIDSAIVGLSISYALNVSNNDFVVYDMFIIQLIKLSSSLPVWIIDRIS